MIKDTLLKFLKAHWISLLAVAALAVCLKISLGYSFILSFLILLLAYFLLGVLVEFLMEKITHSKEKQNRKTEPEKSAPVRTESRTHTDSASRKCNASGMHLENVTGRTASEREQANAERLVRVSTTMRNIIDVTPKDAEKENPASSDSFVPERPAQKQVVLQKQNVSPRPITTDGLEKVNGRRHAYTESHKTDADFSASSDFYVRCRELYLRNTDRNLNQEKADPAPEEMNAEMQEQPVIPEKETAPAEPPKKEPVAEDFEPLRSSGDIERISDDLTKEIDRRIAESRYDIAPRKKDYGLEPKPEQMPVEEQPVISKPEEEEETVRTDITLRLPGQTRVRDRVHTDERKLDALFARREPEEKENPEHRNGFSSWFKKKDMPDAQSQAPNPEKPAAVYAIPSVELLRHAKEDRNRSAVVDADSDPRAQKLIDTLSSFGVGARVIAVIKGPAVTRYEIQPNPGVKVSRIVSLADDISLNLAATGVRIEAPIPGKEAVGIEVPNQEVEIVYLRDVIESREYQESQSKLTFAIGKDIAGKNIVADISKMPHLLIAGATGAGKSVCINTIIASILYKSGPEDVRMIMIDPKIVELGIYNGIPHLLVPVVTNPKKAAAALSWAVGEMERRYGDFSQYNVRDIKSYNMIAAKKKGMKPMPQIVIIIDELADLMMVAAKEIEDSIIRLAQKARAAGLHIVIATQRPSVDVITGLIKANIPSRIAFAVSSQVDSRTILDGAGAEKLLGRGDMLFHPIGMSKPLRVQGAFVSDGEIEALVSEIKTQFGQVEYSAEIQASMEAKAGSSGQNAGGASAGGSEDGEDCDAEVLRSAAELAFEYKQLSTSFLQRKLKLGYSRASRIVDTLESEGLISGADGSKPRQLLMTREEWESRNC